MQNNIDTSISVPKVYSGIHECTTSNSAIAIKKTRFSDNSLIITWMTPEVGKIKTIARGILKPKSPFSGHIDLFHETKITWKASRKSDLHNLSAAEISKPFSSSPPIHTMMMASYFAALTNLTSPLESPLPEIHALLQRGLGFLRTNLPTPKALLHFEKQLAFHLGILEPPPSTPIAAIRSYAGNTPDFREPLLSPLPSPSFRPLPPQFPPPQNKKNAGNEKKS